MFLIYGSYWSCRIFGLISFDNSCIRADAKHAMGISEEESEHRGKRLLEVGVESYLARMLFSRSKGAQ